MADDTDLDITHWPRRAAFEFYRGFDRPYFSICTRIDVTALKPALAQAGIGSVTLACHFVALHWANRLAPFRYRLIQGQQGRVRVLGVVHASTTVLRADESFGFAWLRHAQHFFRDETENQLRTHGCKARNHSLAKKSFDVIFLGVTHTPVREHGLLTGTEACLCCQILRSVCLRAARLASVADWAEMAAQARGGGSEGSESRHNDRHARA